MKEWRTQGEDAKLPLAMNLRLCWVTVTDMEGVKHSAEVTASTLLRSCSPGPRGNPRGGLDRRDRGRLEHRRGQLHDRAGHAFGHDAGL